jgi:hypothetical protein
LRQSLVMRLGEHYEFQAAQRIAANNLFAASERDPDFLAVSWDKMDQAKTIVPRVSALANTSFQKCGTRIVVSLIGVRAPGISATPWVYTILEDQVQGSDMISSLMLDVLQDAAEVRGQLPRRLFIQADNTAKETKNTIVLFAAAWLLANLKGTRLERIEFGYLIVGHTHDLIDAFFAYINKAVHGQNILSMPDFFACLQKRMRCPPLWKCLRDVYAFKDNQPDFLSTKNIVGIGAPHHLRLSWGRDGSIALETKRFLTSQAWSSPICICDVEQVRLLQRLRPPAREPEWDGSLARSGLNWIGKLRALLQEAGHPPAGLDHCEKVFRHELPEFLPSGLTLQQRLEKLRGIRRPTCDSVVGGSSSVGGDLETACLAAFPGSSGGTSKKNNSS